MPDRSEKLQPALDFPNIQAINNIILTNKEGKAQPELTTFRLFIIYFDKYSTRDKYPPGRE